MDPAAWRAAVEEERRARDALYLGPDTPLSPERRAEFKGLRWFPISEDWRVEARLRRHPVPRPAALASSGEDALRMDEVGVLELSLQGVACRLLAFSPAPGESDEDFVLVPFRDGTSGKETYGGGRYLDLEPDASGVHEVDLNRAYHPYCAHDDAWSCTLPPPENRLPVRVEAGERLG